MNPIFNRNNNTPSGIQRSRQDGLSRRKTFTQHYGRLYPNFRQILYPNETIDIRTTNFVRSVPMVTPQLSRVRLFQSFVAVPLRILWPHWEEYIKGDDPTGYEYEEPYICNAINPASGGAYISHYNNNDADNPRVLRLTSDGYPQTTVSEDNNAFGYLFYPDELGEAMETPKYMGVKLKAHEPGVDVFPTLRRTAYDFAAYQLAYSYFYRNANVQVRQDDFFDLVNETANAPEYRPYAFQVTSDGSVSSVYRKDSFPAVVGSDTVTVSNTPKIYDGTSGTTLHASKVASSDTEDIWRTSWEFCEKFPLRNGPNFSLSALCLNSDGDVIFKPSTISLTRWRYVNWGQDRFTTANPWQQRGDESVIPVSGTITVNVNTTSSSTSIPVTTENGATLKARFNSTTTIDPHVYHEIGSTNDDTRHTVLFNDTDDTVFSFERGQYPLVVDGITNISSTAVATPSLYVTPSDFRFAQALQRIEEMSAATDNRYKSYLMKFFGANLHDGRADRPEYLGGYVQDINVSEVLQTSEDGNTPLGTSAGIGRSGDTGYNIHYKASEHTIILGLTYILPDTEYISGLDREWNTQDRFDWCLPQLSGLSEQPIYFKEIADLLGNPDTPPDGVFGYEPAYNYLRWKDSKASSDFNDPLNVLGSYEYYKPWLVTRDFGSKFEITNVGGLYITPNVPTLSDAFLSTRNSSDYSNFQVDKSVMNPFMQDSYFKVSMVRNIPGVGIPKL